MEYAIYPFDRYNKIRLYVRFFDQYDNEITRSTGISYSYDASNSERKVAKKKAEKKGQEIIENYFDDNQEAYQHINKNPRLSDFLKTEYWPYCEANSKERTVNRYRTNLGHFIRICKDRPMDAYRRLDMERFKQKRLKEVKKTTINIDMRGIKVAFNWAYKYDFIDKTPYMGEDFLFDVKLSKRAFTGKEMDTLLEYTEGENIGLVIRLAYYTGMRIGAVSGLTWNYVHLNDNPFLHIPVALSKTDKPRNIPLSIKGIKVVQAFRATLEEKKQRFPEVYENRPPEETYLVQKQRGWGKYSKRSIQEMFRKAMDKAGLPRELTFHCLRHSFATHLLEDEGILYKVSKLLGHTSTDVTQKFYDHTDNMNFRDTVNRL